MSKFRQSAFASVLVFLFAAVFGGASARADAVTDFYKGKNAQMIIGSSAGGGYDQFGRLVARHMSRHIPGKPAIAPKNLPGGSGRKALNYVANVAKPDGLTMGIVSRNTHFDKLLYGDKSVDVDSTKLVWLGSANSEVSLCVTWHSTSVKTIQDAAKGMTIGGSGPTATDTLMARILNQIAGTKIKVILGYPGSTEVHLAMERGEVTGRCGFGWDSIVSRYYDWYKDKKINLLVQLATNKHPDLPHVPSFSDFAKTDAERQMLRIFTIPNEMGRPFFMRAGVPEDRVKALRRGFMDTLKDAQFLAEAKKQTLAVDPLDGETVEKMVKQVYDSSPEAIRLASMIVSSPEKLEKRKENFYTVSVALKSAKNKGRELTFDDKGKEAKAVLTGDTEIMIGGKAAKSSGLQAGMNCDVTYEGNLSVAKTVACK